MHADFNSVPLEPCVPLPLAYRHLPLDVPTFDAPPPAGDYRVLRHFF